MLFCDECGIEHGNRLDSKNGETAFVMSICQDCITKDKILNDEITWKQAAMRIGEDLINHPPNFYYDLSPKEWLELALKSYIKN